MVWSMLVADAAAGDARDDGRPGGRHDARSRIYLVVVDPRSPRERDARRIRREARSSPRSLVAADVSARADPLRLRADALATHRGARRACSRSRPTATPGAGLSAEAVVWIGDRATAATTRRRRARDRAARAHARRPRERHARPVRRDARRAAPGPRRRRGGARAAAASDRCRGATRASRCVPGHRDRAPGTGSPAAASRAGSATGARSGVAYVQQRDDGRLATEELGVDAGAALGKHDDVAAQASPTTSRTPGSPRSR